MSNRSLVLVLLFTISALLSKADQIDTSQLLHFNIDNGLPSNNIYNLVQDHNGYIWLATDNGAVKYNGYSFKIFNVNNGLPVNDVYQIFPDSHNRIWVTSLSNKFGYIRNDKYTNVHTATGDGIIRVLDLREINGNLFFFLNHNGQMLGMVTPNDSWSALLRFKEADMLEITPALSMIFSAGGKQSPIKELYIENKSVKLRTVSPEIGLLYHTRCRFKPFGWYLFYHGVLGDNFIYYDIKKSKCLTLNITDIGGKPGEKFFTSDVFGDSLVLISTKAFYTFDTNMNLKRRIPFTSVLTGNDTYIFEYRDRARNNWYVSKTNGIWMAPPPNNIIHKTEELSLIKNLSFVGNTANGKSFWYNKLKEQVIAVDGDLHWDPSFKMAAKPNAIVPLGKDSAYFLGSTFIYIIDGKDKIYHIFKQGTSISMRNFLGLNAKLTNTDNNTESALGGLGYDIIPVNDSLNLVAGYGIIKWTTHNKKHFKFTWLNNGRYIKAILDSATGKYIFYNQQLLSVLNPLNNQIITLDNLQELFHFAFIYSIKTDGNGNVFVLTNNGLFLANLHNFSYKRINVNADLNDAYMEIYKGKLILAGSFGIAYAAISGAMSVSSFRYVPSLHSFSRLHAFYLTPSGSGILNSNKGVYSFNADTLFHSKDAFELKNGGVIKLMISAPEQKGLFANDTINCNQNLQKFKLDLINFYGRGKQEYDYQIDNSPEVQTAETGEIIINDLNPNRYYKFSVIAKDDIWKSNPYIFYIYRIPYWYQTSTWKTIFWIIGFLFLTALLITAILITKNLVARANEKKRANTELQLRAVYAQINPHFIFNTLSAAMYYINSKRIDEAYQHVSKFSKLLRGYLKSAQERYITLAEEVNMLRNYIELQQVRFENRFDYTIDIDNKIPADSLQIPSLLLQPLVENAINHGLFHKQGKGLLSIKFLQGSNNDELICIIEDNGIGRLKAKEINQANTAKRESYGTKLTDQLIEIFKQYEQMNISVEYMDKEAPDTGTIVKLIIRNLKYVA